MQKTKNSFQKISTWKESFFKKCLNKSVNKETKRQITALFILSLLFFWKTITLVDLWHTGGRALKDKLRALLNNYTRKGSDRRSAFATAGLPVAGSASRLSAVCVFFLSLLAHEHRSHIQRIIYLPVIAFLGPAVCSRRVPWSHLDRTSFRQLPARLNKRFSHLHIFQKACFARRRWDLRASCHLSFAIGTCNTLCGTLLFCALCLVAFPIFIR